MSRYLRAVAAATVLLVLVLAPPAGLALMFGNPSQGWADVYAGDVSGTALLDVLATLTWLAWANFAIAVIREILAVIRHTPLPRITGLLPGQRLARTLVVAAFLVLPTAGPVLAAPPASAAGPASPAAEATWSVTGPDTTDPPRSGPASIRAVPAAGLSGASSPRGSPEGQPVPGAREVIIGADGPFTFWGLAARYLGEGERWEQVWHLNQGRTQPDGTVMSSPHWLSTGWSVLVPDTTPVPHLVPEDTATSPAAAAAPTATGTSDSGLGFGFGAGAGLLAGVSLSELVRRWHRQSRHRRLGRVPASTPPELAGTTKALLIHGPGGQHHADALDHALRTLARDLTHAGTRLPDVSAVRLSQDSIALLLCGHDPGVHPPSPWKIEASTGQWQVPRQPLVRPERAQRLRRTQVPPYPGLVSIGITRTSEDLTQDQYAGQDWEHWLLDLEATRVLTLSGDRHRCRGLARAMVAELANTLWCEQLQVSVAGLGSTLSALNQDRITCTPDLRRAIVVLHAQLQANQTVLRTHEIDLLRGRAEDIAGDVWYPHILIIDPDVVTTDPDPGETLRQIRDLAAALHEAPGRVGLALVLTQDLPVLSGSGEPAPLPGTHLHLDTSGRMHAPSGQPLTAAYLPAQAATQLAGVLTAAGRTHDQPTPAARGQHPWDALADAGGAPRRELTVAGTAWAAPPASRGPLMLVPPDTGPPRAGQSLLGPAPATIVARTATTADDITALAPPISPPVRRQIADADPDLDADLADWHRLDTDRARLSLLGPVQVRARGTLPPGRRRESWHTEVIAYLAAHPRGVTSDKLGGDLWPEDPDITKKPRLRQAVYVARQWLHTNPLTGQLYIPSADAALPGGLRIYQVEGLLVDADLFRRLRLRAVSTGPHGIHDLLAALDLVTGPPFDRRRPGGYTWLVDTPLDVEYTAMIVDVAHLVATHYLSTGHPDIAAAAARVALSAGSQDDTPLLDLVAACDAQGQHSEADSWVQHIITTHDAEIEEDLPPRTFEILQRRKRLNSVS